MNFDQIKTHFENGLGVKLEENTANGTLSSSKKRKFIYKNDKQGRMIQVEGEKDQITVTLIIDADSSGISQKTTIRSHIFLNEIKDEVLEEYILNILTHLQ